MEKEVVLVLGKSWNQYRYCGGNGTHASRVLIWKIELKRTYGYGHK